MLSYIIIFKWASFIRRFEDPTRRHFYNLCYLTSLGFQVKELDFADLGLDWYVFCVLCFV